MRARLILYPALAAILAMLGINALGRHEKLAVDDGKRAPAVLPLDRESSQIAYQTATFGLG